MELQAKRTIIARSMIAVSMLLFLVSLYFKAKQQGGTELESIIRHRNSFWVTISITFVILATLTIMQIKWYAVKAQKVEIDEK